MKKNQSYLHILKAKHGDAFVLECNRGKETGTIVVDGGPTAGTKISELLCACPSIDLMVLTHFDDDHIGGILKYVKFWQNREEPIPVKEMWLNNCISSPMTASKHLSLKQANTLKAALDCISQRNQNLQWDKYIREGMNFDYPFAEIEVMSPNARFQEEMVRRQIKDAKKNLTLSGGDEERIEEKKYALERSLEDLALNTKPEVPRTSVYGQAVNASSIAMVVRCDGLSVLLLGDSYPQPIEAFLRSQGYSKKKRLKVDYVKMAHHGSRHNSSCSLLDLIDCNNYIFTTDGGHGFHHPDRETMARILCRPGRNKEQKIHLYFNYKRSINQGDNRFLKKGEETAYNFELHFDVETLPLNQE